uniref:Transposase n=1 Tax=Caenorhabditis tropicalis TaxID=1561998 RepID=A0A1I7TPB2_9PELO
MDFPKKTLTTEQEMFLYELETSKSCPMENLVIYDTDNIQQFVFALQISQYDKNTQNVCYLHHESILEALQELIQLKEYCQGRRYKTQWKDSEILRISHRLCHKKREIWNTGKRHFIISKINHITDDSIFPPPIYGREQMPIHEFSPRDI